MTYGSATSSAGMYHAYDQAGRVIKSIQRSDDQNYQVTCGYDLSGAVTSETYPSGRSVLTTYDAAGRVSGITGQKTGEANKTYASAMSYTSHGAVAAVTLGNALIEQVTFNNRLQPTQIKLGTAANPTSVIQLGYGYGTTNNNGNVLSQTITAPGLNVTQGYTYDALNRLASASEGTTWTQTYDYDRYSNRAVRSGSYMPNPLLTPQSGFAGDMSGFNAGNNRVAVSGFQYDGAGNLKADPTTGPNAMIYDAENRLIGYTSNNTQASYVYDGEGRRVKKSVSGVTTVFVYDSASQLIAEYTSATPANGGTKYLTTDHLSSTRLATDSGGNVKARYDYLPFGEELAAGTGSRTTLMGYGVAENTRH